VLVRTDNLAPQALDVMDTYSSAGNAPSGHNGHPVPLLLMRGISRSFGTTRAVQKVDIVLNPSEVVGLMGGNGAGKSTLMKIVGGLIAADEGQIELLGVKLRADHSPAAARRLGVRFVHQELSLCPNLRVFESFAVELPDLIKGVRWRSRAVKLAVAALAEVFPGNHIDPRAKISSLSLSQQQMVEIASAASHPGTRLLILDEPTSSLGSHEANQLRAYMKRRRAEGMSFIFISHRLRETLDLADRIVVMRNGSVPWSGEAGRIGQPELLQLLGGGAGDSAPTPAAVRERPAETLVRLDNVHDHELRGVSIQVARGEIVGLAGLEGSGQRQVLRSIFGRGKPDAGTIQVEGEVAFVSGDRVAEGVFPLWSIDDNIAISSLKRLSNWGFVSAKRMREVTAGWFRRLQVQAPSGAMAITSLSGGNQQKVVIARALAAEADVVLLDDPTRGVDLGTKAELYKLFRSLADEGRAVLWYSTDDVEFAECDRTIVMRDGIAMAELPRHQAKGDRLAEASFRAVDEATISAATQTKIDRQRKLEASIPTLIPLVTFGLVFSLCALQNFSIVSPFGLTLVFSAAFSLAFAAISQLFIIAAGDIDLGIGPFIGLVNALAATWLVTDPWLALACFAGLLIAYPLMGLFIHARRVPAIIVTLGMSFVWLGLAAYRLPRAGGGAPDWLVEMLKVKLPILPVPVLLCLLPAVAAYLLLMVWRYGAVLRGFGANPRAIEAAGWSTRAAKATLYGVAGTFAFLSGIIITGSTLGGDPTGATSMTLLSVAAVILGGASFAGGVVAPIGALFGVLTLVLVGTLLSLLGVNGVYLPMVQGLILLGVVGVRTLLVRKSA
jgi:ribose transport system ATP-binding protein